MTFCESSNHHKNQGISQISLSVEYLNLSKLDVKLAHDLVKKMHAEKVTQIFLNTMVSTGPIDNPDFVKLKTDNFIKFKFAFELKSSDIKIE